MVFTTDTTHSKYPASIALGRQFRQNGTFSCILVLCHHFISLSQVLHLQAVNCAFAYLDPPISKDAHTLKKWMREVQQSQNAVDSILLLPTTPKSFSRCAWHNVLQLLQYIHLLSQLCSNHTPNSFYLLL